MCFSELQRAIPQATAKMFIQQLREMEGDELVVRKVYPVVPPRTEYSLTGLGKSLVPIVNAMDKWGEAWFQRMGLQFRYSLNVWSHAKVLRRLQYLPGHAAAV